MGNTVLIQLKRTEDLDEAMRAHIINLCIDAHGEPGFSHLFEMVPAGGLHVFATINDQVIGHAMVTTRWAQPEGYSELRTAYIDAVSTSPAHQRQGIGSLVMMELVKRLNDFQIACLETDKPAFYERLGWRIWRGPKAGRSEHGLIMTPSDQIVMVHTLAGPPVLNLEGLLTIECQSNRIW